ncbi:hypothetical protein Pan44_05030 [Caulifigura coniformis]|uniref:Uncharacterized protein n=1 Tax=Caulifigura coniformis TaxID=2527983 RepID=A0A517S8P0_9PLAN|nr:hypothetical protein Pan44_05030 [Caulifigura coniformis]
MASVTYRPLAPYFLRRCPPPAPGPIRQRAGWQGSGLPPVSGKALAAGRMNHRISNVQKEFMRSRIRPAAITVERAFHRHASIAFDSTETGAGTKSFTSQGPVPDEAQKSFALPNGPPRPQLAAASFSNVRRAETMDDEASAGARKGRPGLLSLMANRHEAGRDDGSRRRVITTRPAAQSFRSTALLPSHAPRVPSARVPSAGR